MSNDDIMNRMNARAKAEGRYLDKTFWEIPCSVKSILNVPSTPESEQRIALLRASMLEKVNKEIVTPDDLECGEIVHSGSFDCTCGCDLDKNICFLDSEGMKKVTHLKCRACGKLTPFYLDSGEIK